MKINMKLPVTVVTSAHKETITERGLYFFIASEIVWKGWFMFLDYTKMYWLGKVQDSTGKEHLPHPILYMYSG